MQAEAEKSEGLPRSRQVGAGAHLQPRDAACREVSTSTLSSMLALLELSAKSTAFQPYFMACIFFVPPFVVTLLIWNLGRQSEMPEQGPFYTLPSPPHRSSPVSHPQLQGICSNAPSCSIAGIRVRINLTVIGRMGHCTRGAL